MRALIIASILGFAMLGCDSGGGSTSDKSGQINGSCQGATGFSGQGSSGASCSDAASDCTPSCCPCDNGQSKTWASASCVDGKCATSSVTCGRTKDNSVYCAP